MPSQKCFQGSQSLSTTLSTTELRQHARRYGGNFLVTKVFFFAKLVWWFNLGGRVAKSGYSNENGYTSDGKHWRFSRLTRTYIILARQLINFSFPKGRSYGDINDELWITSIAMAILILILIGLALLYILYEKCQKKWEHFVHA